VPPPPGRLVDIGGYRLHLDCTGTGSPTVILEAGLGDLGISWSEVQPGPAEIRQVQSLGAMPLIVVSAGKSFWEKPESWAAWQAMQASDTTMSSSASRVIADGSQHEVEHDRPDAIIAQVERMLKALRGFH
jgi:hypothetical protein